MAKLVGFEAKTFMFEDGKTVSGFYLHTEDKISGVTGTSVDRTFVSEKEMRWVYPRPW